MCDLEPPSWHALAKAVRPPPREAEDFDPGCCRDGWQHEAASRVEWHFRDSDFFTRIDAARTTREGMELGWHCPRAPRTVSFRRLPLPLTARSCQRGRPLDSCPHHRAACARAGVLACGKQEGESPRSNQAWWMPGDLKWRFMACLSSVAHNWQWMPLSSAPSVLTAPPDGELSGLTGWRCGKHVEGRSTRTPSWWVVTAEFAWLCWASKSWAGRKRCNTLFLSWPGPRQEVRPT